MHKRLVLSALIFISFGLMACGASTTPTLNTVTLSIDDEDTSVPGSGNDGTISFITTTTTGTGDTSSGDTSSALAEIVLPEGGDGSAITVSGRIITISAGGTFVLRGTGADVQIVVAAPEDEFVTLILDGTDLSSSEGPVILGQSCEKLILHRREGSENSLTSVRGTACVVCDDDLTVNGAGSLRVSASVGHGLDTDDSLVIAGGTLILSAPMDALRANDSVSIVDASLTMTAGNDGIHAGNSETAGIFYMESGTLVIQAYGDGIDASGSLTILDGTIDIASGIGNANITLVSAKGLKAGETLQIGGGSLTIQAKDDAIHSDGSVLIAGGSMTLTTSDEGIRAMTSLFITGGDPITIVSAGDGLHSADTLTVSGGNLTISASDDAVHAETTLRLSGGSVNITKSYEGLEALDIIISGGVHHVVSSDDGLNAAGGNDASATYPWNGGMTESSNASITIEGGTLYVNAKGDGIDANGSITMTGGTVIVSGPTDNGNGPLDYNSGFNTKGGFLLAVGSSGMAQNIGTDSSQYGALIFLSASSTALIRIEDASGNEIATYQPPKAYTCVLISCPSLAKNGTYSLYSGGSVNSYSSLDSGFYTQASYTAGTLLKSFTVSTIATSVGSGGTTRPR